MICTSSESRTFITISLQNKGLIGQVISFLVEDSFFDFFPFCFWAAIIFSGILQSAPGFVFPHASLSPSEWDKIYFGVIFCEIPDNHQYSTILLTCWYFFLSLNMFVVPPVSCCHSPDVFPRRRNGSGHLKPTFVNQILFELLLELLSI